MMKQALAVFIKNPELGKVKTRIAKDAGDAEALKIYKTLLEITKDTLTSLEFDIHIFYDQRLGENDLWKDKNFIKHIQQGKNLGDRMLNAFDILMKQDYDQVILMGSDCPYIKKSHLFTAFSELSRQDLVIGPTFDGGYYLIGMKTLHSSLLLDMEWSVETVLLNTIQRANVKNLSVHLLEKLADIDHWEDWKKYTQQNF